MSSYLFRKGLYSLSFKDRVLMDIGCLSFQSRTYSRELDALSDKELEHRLKMLKAPWWNDFYQERLRKNKKILYIMYLLGIRKEFSWQSLRLLYRILHSKELC